MFDNLIFSVYDSAKDIYLAPFLSMSTKEAKRFIYQQLKQSPDSLLSMYRHQYHLKQIGNFNSRTAKVTDNLTKDLGTLNNLFVEQQTELLEEQEKEQAKLEAFELSRKKASNG